MNIKHVGPITKNTLSELQYIKKLISERKFVSDGYDPRQDILFDIKYLKHK